MQGEHDDAGAGFDQGSVLLRVPSGAMPRMYPAVMLQVICEWQSMSASPRRIGIAPQRSKTHRRNQFSHVSILQDLSGRGKLSEQDRHFSRTRVVGVDNQRTFGWNLVQIRFIDAA
jgi:hypothetical protein